MARIVFFTFLAILYCFFYQSISFWPNWTISKRCAHLIKYVCYFYKSKKVRGFLGFSAFLQISFLTPSQNPFFLFHPLDYDWNMVCTNFQIGLRPTWLKIPKIGSKNSYFQFFHFSPPQNPIFLVASCPTRFKYVLYP